MDELVPGSFIFVPGFRDKKYQSKTKTTNPDKKYPRRQKKSMEFRHYQVFFPGKALSGFREEDENMKSLQMRTTTDAK
jgi:hypothetical protein